MKKLKPTDLKGFVSGEHQPYTDYNQEIIDWLADNSNETEFDEQDRKYIFCGKSSFYTHDVTYKHEVYYTNEQFMEWIGMTKKTSENTFTKSDLKDGMICTTRNGNVYTLYVDRLLREGGMYVMLEDINDDLICEGLDEFDIIRVEQPTVVFERVDLNNKLSRKN